MSHRFLVLLAAAFALLIATAPSGTNAAGQSAVCKVFAEHYVKADKRLAKANFSIPRTAPQQPVRQLRLLNERTTQLLLIEQMKGHGCPIPITISGQGYSQSALTCAFVRDPNSQECDIDRWERED